MVIRRLYSLLPAHNGPEPDYDSVIRTLKESTMPPRPPGGRNMRERDDRGPQRRGGEGGKVRFGEYTFMVVVFCLDRRFILSDAPVVVLDSCLRWIWAA